MATGGQRLDAYSLNSPDRNEDVCPNRLILRETFYNIHKLKQYIADNEPLLNSDQADVYNFVLGNINTRTGGIIFLNAPVGTGKTFLLNLLLAKLKHNGDFAIAVASPGIASTVLDGGRTAHSTFKLPFNVAHQENLTCHIIHSSDEATILNKYKLIVWDEVTMSYKCSLQALHTTMRDFRANNNILEGATLLLAGDFRQTMPIIPKGTLGAELNACFKKNLFFDCMPIETTHHQHEVNPGFVYSVIRFG
ncbi:ATP-dependent DNA helicase PIF5-like [Octopus sinensis]|uniref:ATP-dependent DNA helicase n=1 Tax=Octopus sinensis TaxID=2607531 RepID=A0A6P7U7J8_9MOLL|nr:ATP-dependent DNA helicase PIF5-like [Octopus sinensis]